MQVFNCLDSVDKLLFSVRTSNVLKNAGIETIEQLLNRYREVPNFRNAGAKTVREINDFIHRTKIEDGKIYISDVLYFVDENEVISGEEIQGLDIPISYLGLSKRALHIMNEQGFEIISDIVDFEFEDFMRFKNMGVGTANEIIKALGPYKQERIKIRRENIRNDPDLNRAFDDLKKLSNNEKLLEDILFDIREKYPEVHAESFTIVLYRSKEVSTLLKEFIERKLDKYNGRLEKSYFQSKLPVALQNTMELDECLLELERAKIVTIKGEDIIRRYPSFLKFLENKSFKDKDIILMKLQGKTLEEIGSNYGITRERIRQRLGKALKQCNVRYVEDKYLSLWAKYQFSLDDFLQMFPEETKETYYYLKMRDEAVKGKKKLSEIENDDTITIDYKERYYKGIGSKRYIRIGSRKIYKTETGILKFVFESFGDKEVSLQELKEAYIEFVNQNCPDALAKLETSDRNVDAMLSRDINALCIGNYRYRYHNFEEYDFEAFVKEIEIQQYENQCISANLFLQKFPDLMNRYDLRNPNEIHNYLKNGFDRFPALIPNGLKFTGRNPTIKIGHCDREEQIRSLMFQLAPIDQEAFIEAYSEKYGDNPLTILGTYIKCIDDYYMDGFYMMNQNPLTEEELLYLKTTLIKDFYSLEQIQNIYNNYFPEGDVGKLNQLNLRKVGFKTYTGYAISDKYSSALDFLNQNIFSHEIINLEDVKDEYPYLWSTKLFVSSFYDKKRSGELIEFMPGQYISKLRLERAGITDNDIETFIDRVKSFVEPNSYFTLPSIVNDGFENTMDEYGFEDVFFESLIIIYPEVFSYRNIGGRKLFYYGKKSITCCDFIEWILSIEKKIELDDLVSLMQDRFGLAMDRAKVHSFVNEADVYFDEIYDSVYIDYDYYFEEI